MRIQESWSCHSLLSCCCDSESAHTYPRVVPATPMAPPARSQRSYALARTQQGICLRFPEERGRMLSRLYLAQRTELEPVVLCGTSRHPSREPCLHLSTHTTLLHGSSILGPHLYAPRFLALLLSGPAFLFPLTPCRCHLRSPGFFHGRDPPVGSAPATPAGRCVSHAFVTIEGWLSVEVPPTSSAATRYRAHRVLPFASPPQEGQRDGKYHYPGVVRRTFRRSTRRVAGVLVRCL